MPKLQYTLSCHLYTELLKWIFAQPMPLAYFSNWKKNADMKGNATLLFCVT
jgi:hypothetical protein